jgi:cytochrome c-type biogenesis protein CcmH/NrfG
VSVALAFVSLLLGVVAAAGILAPALSRRPLPAIEVAGPWAGAEANGGRARSAAASIMVLLVVVAAAVPLLVGAVEPRDPRMPITGRVPGPAPLSLLESRVRDHPEDPAARLDLADAYLVRGQTGNAVDQYLALVAIDPGSPDAHARLGLVLYRSGRPRAALDAVDRALEIDPSYPEALYERGVILLRGLDRPAPAASAFRSYLEEAPFGAHRAEVRDLLGQAERLASKPLG